MALIGPRQCGKTTLAREFVKPDALNYFDLEDPISLARLDEPMMALQNLEGLVVIDEIQRRPELFPILRVLVDRDEAPSRFLILGSASPELLQQSSESLAGRIEVIPMSGFNLHEVGADAMMPHWLRGGFPRSFLAENDSNSMIWRKNFVQTFLERDIPQLGINIPAHTLHRFWTMLSHYHGQIWNGAELAKSMGVTQPTIRRYLDILVNVFMIRQLQPWHANLKKRQIKSPKIYLRDSGLFHHLQGIHTEYDLMTHRKLGASWEGYVIEEVINIAQPEAAYFWSTYNGAEIDLLLFVNGRPIGFECKRMDAPRLTNSMRIALQDLALEHLYVIYPGDRTYPLSEQITVLPLEMVRETLA